MPAPRKHVTLFDICRAAEVSSATVSRVINESPLVQEDTRRKVLKVIKDLGYRPSHAAQMLARQRTDTLGVVLPDINSNFDAQVLAGIDEAAVAANCHMLTTFAHGERNVRALLRRFADERRVDAVVVMSSAAGLESSLKDIKRSGLPLVILDRPVAGYPSVSIDNESGARQVVNHLLALGRKSIAFLSGPDENYDAVQRLAGTQAAMAEAGAPLASEYIWPGDFREESAVEAIRAWSATGKPWPDAIFACNDTMAFGVLASLRELGLRVPEDIAVMGFDDSMGARWLGLSTVRIPVRRLGQAAASMALQLSKRQAIPSENIEIPVELIIRQTCGKIPAR